MVVCKRPERVGRVGWRLLLQVLGHPTSQPSAFLQEEVYSTYAHLEKQNHRQNVAFEDSYTEIVQSSFGRLVGNPTGHIGHGSTLCPVQFSSCSHLNRQFFKGSFGKRDFVTQSDHHDEIGAEFSLSESDFLSSDDDRINETRTMTRGHLSAAAAAAADDDDDVGRLYESDAMDLSISEEDTSDDEDNRETPQQITRAKSNALDDDEDGADSAGEGEFKTRSLLDDACASVVDNTGDKKCPLWKRLEEATGKKTSTLKDVLEAWTDEGNPLTRAVIVYTITILRRRRKYWKALEVSDWVLTEKPFPLNEMDYGIRIELIAKVQGAEKAADYFGMIPKQFQGPMTYSILMTVYVEQNKEKEAVNLLKKVDLRGCEHRTYMYNQLLYLYKKNGLIAGFAEVLQTMDEKNIEPDIFTYNMILDVRARKGDAPGMEKVWSQLKQDKNTVPDATTYSILAKGYMTAGLYDKAEKVVKKIESSPVKKRRALNVTLLLLYGQLRKEEELERVWAMVKQGPKVLPREYITMIRALGRVGNADRAEDIFEEMADENETLTLRQYNALLSVYANLGRIQKGESLLKRIAKATLAPDPATYHELVCLYLKADQSQKAMEILSKVGRASRSIKRRPLYATFQAALEWFADKGDIKNAEKVFRDLKGARYQCSYRSYAVLLKAYTNAELPPYGFLDRLQGDNIIPNQHVRKELRRLEGT